jgi:acid phosphatase family membrane protein YuiD
MSFWDLFQSPVALSGFFALILSQLLKVPIDYLRNRRSDWNWALLLNSGGMPSSHSALMAAVTTSIGFYVGWGSPLFALALAITAIVIYDAAGVRRQAGLHAERINKLVKQLFSTGKIDGEEWGTLRESIGHSRGEALAGVLFGIAVAVVIRLIMPPLA